MKGRSKRLLALLLAAGMLATQIPASPLLVQAETSSDVDAGSEETGLTDDTVVATIDPDQEVDPEYGINLSYWGIDPELFQLVVAAAGKAEGTKTLTYGDVKEITEFTIAPEYDEDGSLKYLSLSWLDKMLPNLEKLVCGRNVGFGTIGSKLTDITINTATADENHYLSVFVPYLKDQAAQIKRLVINADNIGYGTHQTEDGEEVSDLADYTGLQSLTLTSSDYFNTDLLSAVAELPALEELHISGKYIAKDDVAKLTGMESLKTLDISNCTGVEELPDSIMDMKNLKNLNISGCNLTDLPKDFKEKMSGLENLTVANNLFAKDLVLDNIPEQFSSDEEWVKANFDAQNEAVTTGDMESDYYIPDQNLFAAVLKEADANSDGILTVGEAWSKTYLSFNYMNGMDKVEDFTGLGTVFQNVTQLYMWNFHNNTQSEKFDKSFRTEVSKMTKLTNLATPVISQETFDAICESLPNLQSLAVRNGSNDSFDITNIAKLSELQHVELNAIQKGSTALNSLEKLTSLSIYGDNLKLSEIKTALSRLETLYLSYNSDSVDNEELKAISDLENLTSIHISANSSVKNMVQIDLSGLDKLSYIDIYGYVSEVTLPKKADKLYTININQYYSDQQSVTLENLDKAVNLNWLDLQGVNVPDFSAISKMTNLNYLNLSQCGLKSTEGIGNLTNLTTLYLTNMDELKTIDDGIGNLTNLQGLYLRHLGSLNKISDKIKNLTALYNLEIYDNDSLTDIPDCFDQFQDLGSLRISQNDKLTKVPDSISKLTKVSTLDLSYNALESLPDLSGLCTKDGLLYQQSSGAVDGTYVIGDRLRLQGNKLTKDAIAKANLTNDFTDDKNWMIQATSRRYGNGNSLYFPDLTDSYMLYSIEKNQGNTFAYAGDITLSAELLQAIKDKSYYLSLNLLSDENGEISYTYGISSYNLQEWDGNAITLNAPKSHAEDVDSLSQYFTKKPLKAFTLENYTKGLYSSSIYLNNLEDGTYNVYKYDKDTGMLSWINTEQTYNNGTIYLNWYMNSESTEYILTTEDTYNYHNVSGVASGKALADTTGRTLVTEEVKVADGDSYYWTEQETDAFKQLVSDAKTGDTLKVYVDNSYASLTEDTVKALQEKKLKLDLLFTGKFNYYSNSADMVNSTMVIDYAEYDNTDINSYSLYFDGMDEPYAPYSLFNDVKSASFEIVSGVSSVKTYVGNSVVNGKTLYAYHADMANRTLVSDGTVEVASGYVDLNMDGKSGMMFLSDKPVTRTTWTKDEEYQEEPDEPDTPSTPGDADKPGDTDTPSTPDTPSKPDTPSDTPSKPDTPSDTPSKPDTPSDTPSKPDTPSNTPSDKPGDNNTTVTPDPTPDNIVLPTIKADTVTSEKGQNCAPSTVKSTDIKKKSDAEATLKNAMDNTISSQVAVTTQGSMPDISSDLLATAKAKNKDISFNVSNDDNQLLYQMTFDYKTLDSSRIAEMKEPLQLSITTRSDKQDKIKKLTGRTNDNIIQIDGYHGELPGPMKVHYYVGSDHKNGDMIYLYYNDENDKISLIGGSGLVVTNGYVDFTLTHCSTYFLSEAKPADVVTEVPSNPTPGTPAPSNPETPAPSQPQQTPTPAEKPKAEAKKTNVKSADTGDNNVPFLPAAGAAIGVGMLVFAGKRRKDKKEI